MSKITSASDIRIEEYLNYPELRIPMFQREYVWGAEEIEDFWDDLNDNGVKFLGSIILKDESYNSNNKAGFLEVIDGQQRTISLLILLKTISRYLSVLAKARKTPEEENASAHAEDINRLVSKRDRRDLTKVLNYKLILPSDEDNEVLKSVLDGDYFKLKNNKGYRNFYLVQEKLNQVMELFLSKKNKQIEKIESLITLKNNILDIKIIEVLVPTDDDAYMIFETVNDRGADLGAAELLKNHLFAHSKKETQSSIQDEWMNIKKTLSDIGRGIDMTSFLRYYWIGKYNHLGKRKLFKGIKDKLKENSSLTPEKILFEMSNFRRTLEIIFTFGIDEWKSLFDESKKESDDYRRSQRRAYEWFSYKRNLNYFPKSIQYLPIYTGVISSLAKINFNERGFISLLRSVEKINFIYSYLLQNPTNKIDTMLSGIGRNILQSIELGEEEEIRRSVDKGTAEIELFLRNNISKEAVYTKIASLSWSKSADKSIIYFILINLEYLEGGYSRMLIQEDLTLEHVYPKSVEKKGIILDWPVLDFDYSKLGHGLGNLTLLPSSGPQANGSAGEDNFINKRDNFFLSSSYSVNRYFKDFDKWGSDEIESRLKYIQDKIWMYWGYSEN